MEKTTNKAKNETEAINFHGTFLKKAVRDTLEEIEGVRIFEEYPVLYEKDMSLDLLASYQTDRSMLFIPIECKRALPQTKYWLFFETKKRLLSNEAKTVYILEKFNDQTKLGFNQTPVTKPVCTEGMEIETTDGINFKANPSTIWSAAEQISRSCTGFVLQEQRERKRSSSRESFEKINIFPVLITTAKLYIAEYDDAKIKIEDGNYPDQIEKREVPFLTLNHPFIPERNGESIFDAVLPGEERIVYMRNYDQPSDRMGLLKQGIVVVNSAHIKDFFLAIKKS